MTVRLDSDSGAMESISRGTMRERIFVDVARSSITEFRHLEVEASMNGTWFIEAEHLLVGVGLPARPC